MKKVYNVSRKYFKFLGNRNGKQDGFSVNDQAGYQDVNYLFLSRNQKLIVMEKHR